MSQDYDKDLINREVVAICDYYLTDKRGEGKRQSYLCPACGDRDFEVDPDRGYAGCFDAGCEAPTTTDALGIIAYFEDKTLSGEGFVVCLKKGYEILGIPDPEQEKSAQPTNTNEGRPKAMTARKDRASSREKAMTPRSDRGRGEEGASDNGHNGAHSSGPQWGAATSSPVETSNSALTEQPIQAWQENADGTRSAVAAVVIREPEPQADTEDGEELEDAELAEETEHRTNQQTGTTDERQSAHEVFDELLKLCRREDRDESFLIGRGLDEQTIEEGRFGSISKSRCNYVVSRLRKKFSDEELLSVPGFRKTEGGQLRFSLYGDYALIPYFDNEGYIRTVEGRFTGEEMGEHDKRYKALLNSAVHLYVHPRYRPDEVVAICEGAIGAMVAARYGFAVASIKGFRNYRSRVDGDGNLYAILPELEGVDFAGKVVVYIPDVDVKPKSYESVMKTVPKACHWMIERQGGIPKVAMLPEGAKDLDAWILSLEEEEREEKLAELLAGAMPIEQFEEQYLGEDRQEELSPEEDSSSAVESEQETTQHLTFSGSDGPADSEPSSEGSPVDASRLDKSSGDEEADTASGGDQTQVEEQPRASSGGRQIFGKADASSHSKDEGSTDPQLDARQQPLDGFTEVEDEEGDEKESNEQADEPDPASNRREYGRKAGNDSEPTAQSNRQQGEGDHEGGGDQGKEDGAAGAEDPTLADESDVLEQGGDQEDDTTEMEAFTEAEADYGVDPIDFEVSMKGEWALATVVYVAAAIVLTILIAVFTGRYLGWIEIPLWWEMGLAAFCAIWITTGFRKLRKRSKAKSLRHHIEGSE